MHAAVSPFELLQKSFCMKVTAPNNLLILVTLICLPMLLVPRTPSIISTASNVVFWTFFRAKTCRVVCHAYCFSYGRTNMARENHIRFDFWDDSTLANQEAGKTIEKPLKELPWNQQCVSIAEHQHWTTNLVRPQLLQCILQCKALLNSKLESKHC